MFDSILQGTFETMEAWRFLVLLLAAIILGALNSFVNYKTQKSLVPSGNMSQTLIILPMLVAVIILLVGSSIASALSLAGAFAIIRFRSPAEPKEISYVLLSMGIGLALGMGYIAYAVIVTIIFCSVMVVIALLNIGEEKANIKLLKIKVPENLNTENVFAEIIAQYSQSYKLLRIKTADLGTVYELNYLVKLKSNTNEKGFIDELRILNGNLTIALLSYANNNDEKI